MGKLLDVIKLLWKNPIVGYIGVMFAEWFFFFCRKKYPTSPIPTTNIPVDVNKDGKCDHCGQDYTVGMDEAQEKTEHVETRKRARKVELEAKPKVKKQATKKVDKLEEPKVAKPKRARRTTKKKTTEEAK